MEASTKSTIEKAGRLHDRIRTGLEWLGSSAPRAVRDALLAKVGAAFARSDVAALERLHRQVQALARSVGMPLDGVRPARNPANPPPAPELPSPSPPRWAAVNRPLGFRRRDHAPIRYPWGEEPPPHPRSSSDILPGKPEHLLPADCRERLAAYRRAEAAAREAPSDACQLHGRVRYHGPDEPPEWYWPANPE